MNRLLLVLIALFQVSLLCLKAEDIDSLLLKEYQSGHRRIMNIIEEENLSDSLQGCSFYVFTFGSIWTFVVEKQNETTLYYRNLEMDNYKMLHFSKKIRGLYRVFSLLNLDMSENRRWYDRVYNPIYSYFTIFDTSHEVIFEWNSATKSAKHERKIRRIIRKYLSFLYEHTDVFGF